MSFSATRRAVPQHHTRTRIDRIVCARASLASFASEKPASLQPSEPGSAASPGISNRVVGPKGKPLRDGPWGARDEVRAGSAIERGLAEGGRQHGIARGHVREVELTRGARVDAPPMGDITG